MVIDCHMHVRKKDDGSLDEAYCDWTVEAGALLGIDVFCVSDSEVQGDLRYEDFHESNERVKQAMARCPARAFLSRRLPPAFLKVQVLDADDEAKSWIAGRSAQRVFADTH